MTAIHGSTTPNPISPAMNKANMWSLNARGRNHIQTRVTKEMTAFGILKVAN
jgi:hypothetical protein